MYKLVRTDQNSHSTTLVAGIHELGREGFLDCKDKRVAHRHSQLSVGEDNKIVLTALHKNPCFVIAKDIPGLIVLTKGMTRELNEGDEFGLLPDAYWYTVQTTKNDNYECEKEADEKRIAICEERIEAVVVKDTNTPSHAGNVLLIAIENDNVKMERDDVEMGRDDVEMERDQCPGSVSSHEMSQQDSSPTRTKRSHSAKLQCEPSSSRAKQLRPSPESLRVVGDAVAEHNDGAADTGTPLVPSVEQEGDRLLHAGLSDGQKEETQGATRKRPARGRSRGRGVKRGAGHTRQPYRKGLSVEANSKVCVRTPLPKKPMKLATPSTSQNGIVAPSLATEIFSPPTLRKSKRIRTPTIKKKALVAAVATNNKTTAPIAATAVPTDEELTASVSAASSSDLVVPLPIRSKSYWMIHGGSMSSQEVNSDYDDDKVLIELSNKYDVSWQHVVYGSDEENSSDESFFPSTPRALSEDIDFREQDEELVDWANVVTKFEDEAIESIAPSKLASFTWSRDFTKFRGTKEKFWAKSGPTVPRVDPLQCFLHFWDESIMSKIVEETNRYAEQQLEQLELTRGSQLHRWGPTTLQEMYLLLSIFILQSVFPLTVESEYWRPKTAFMKTGFPKIMSLNRFILLKEFLHFRNNKEVLAKNHNDAKIAKLQLIIDHLSSKFATSYAPGQHITIDESLISGKSKLPWLEYIDTEAAKFGIKCHELCESETGYVWKFHLTGKSSVPSEKGQDLEAPETAEASTLTVLKLMEGVLNKGHVLFMDNFYNCPSLARFLKSMRTDCVGTVRNNRKHIPEAIADGGKEDMVDNEVISLHSGDLTVLTWKYLKKVSTISTYHSNKYATAYKACGEVIGSKPMVLLDYNLSMGGVDTKERHLSMYKMATSKNSEWYKNMFKRLFNVSIYNAYIIYKASMEAIAGSDVLTHRDFRFTIAVALIERFRTRIAQPMVVSQVHPNSNHGRPIIRNNHFVFQIKFVYGENVPRCVLCNKETMFYCNICTDALCLPDCFYLFHTEKGY